MERPRPTQRFQTPTCPRPSVLFWLSLLVAVTVAATFACPAAGQEVRPTGSIEGTVVRAEGGGPLAGAEVVVRETGSRSVSDAQGRFSFAELPNGRVTLYVSCASFTSAELPVEVAAGSPVSGLRVALERRARFLDSVVVTPSRYTLYQEAPEVRSSLSREDIEKMPHVGDDVFRAARWLPGVTGEDVSSQMNVRGGEVDEMLVIIDGLEIDEGFHLKEHQSLLSIFDAETIDSLEFSSGGFPVEFGNRMSGVIAMSSTGATSSRTSVGLSNINAGILGEGGFDGGRGQWLLSARRTELGTVMRWVDPDSGFDPDFYDVFGKVSYQLGNDTLLSAHVLWSKDTDHYEDEGNGVIDELLDASSSVRYGWFNLKTAWTSRLYSQTVLSTGRVERDRAGWVDYWYQAGMVDDARSSSTQGLKQDWSLDLGDRHALKWGFDLKRTDADYDYESFAIIRDPLFIGSGEPRITERAAALRFEGNSYGIYLADRFRPVEPLVVEVGLRWDRQTVTDEDQISPRLNFAYTLGTRTTLRAAWGDYSQAQRLDELQVGDGMTTFQPAQHAEHRLLSLDHSLASGLDLRLELYQKKLSDVKVRYENLMNPMEILPELEGDRIRVAPERAEAKGVELVLRRDGGRRISWWLSYAYSRAEDRIDGEWVPRSWDQPNTFNFSVNYTPRERWNFNVSGVYHSGWPTTAVYGEISANPDGSYQVALWPGPRNRERLEDYRRVDVRASRDIQLRRSVCSVFLEVSNLFNRDNLGRPESFDFVERPDGTLVVQADYESFFPVIPSFGIRWTF